MFTMQQSQISKQKKRYMEEHGVLNTQPENVRDELFLENNFFDPQDLLQVRYEMIRSHRTDKLTATEASQRFGISRVTFYKISGMYDRKGLRGLIPGKSGPKNPHKCTEEIIEFVKQLRSQEPDMTWEDIIRKVSKTFGVTLHRRTIERGLVRRKKKGSNLNNL